MIATDYGRALLLLAIPISAVFNVLRIKHLYAFALGVGVMGLFFGVASRSMLPSLVSRDQLVEANSKLAIGGSAADVAGPGVAGVLIQTVTAPIALIVDAITFAVSALAIGLIRAQEPEPLRDQNAGGFFSEARQGLALIWRNRVLLAIAGAIGGIEIFNSMLEAVWLLYVNKVLGIEPSAFGLMFSVSGAGFVLGAFFAAWFIRRIGTGRAMIIGVLAAGLSDLATPLAGGPFVAIVALLTAAQFSFAMGATVYGIAQVSIRQAATPLRLQGRERGHERSAGRACPRWRPHRWRAGADYRYTPNPLPVCRGRAGGRPLASGHADMVPARRTGGQERIAKLAPPAALTPHQA